MTIMQIMQIICSSLGPYDRIRYDTIIPDAILNVQSKADMTHTSQLNLYRSEPTTKQWETVLMFCNESRQYQ